MEGKTLFHAVVLTQRPPAPHLAPPLQVLWAESAARNTSPQQREAAAQAWTTGSDKELYMRTLGTCLGLALGEAGSALPFCIIEDAEMRRRHAVKAGAAVGAQA